MNDSARTPAAAVWPDKLITQAEAFAKAATWPVYVASSTYPPSDNMSLYCGKQKDDPEPGQWLSCGQAIGQLRRDGTVYNGTLDEMLSMVLRHMVMAHDVPLNTRAPVPDSADRIPGPPELGPGKRRYGSL